MGRPKGSKDKAGPGIRLGYKWAERSEVLFVLQNHSKMTQLQMAEKLDRSLTFIRKVLYKAKIKKCNVGEHILPNYSEEAMNRISKRIVKLGDCWVMHKNEVKIGQLFYPVSRILYKWHKGIEIQKGHLKRTCTSKNCVNPNHMKIEAIKST